jgi:hypothetical protein
MVFKNNYFTYSDDEFPKVYIELSGEMPSDKEFDEFVQYHDQYMSFNKPIVITYKADRLRFMKGEHRIKIGVWTKNNIAKINENVLGVGYVMNSFGAKLILNGIFIIQKPIWPYLISSKSEEIENWISEKLKENEVTH